MYCLKYQIQLKAIVELECGKSVRLKIEIGFILYIANCFRVSEPNQDVEQ